MVQVQVCPERCWVDTHGNAYTLSKEFITNSKIGLRNEMMYHHFNLIESVAILILFMFITRKETFITKNSQIFSVSISSFSSTIENEFNNILKNSYKVIVWKFSIQSAKIKGGNVFSAFVQVDFFQLLKQDFGVLNNPKPFVVLIKMCFRMEILDLLKYFLKNYGN